MADNISYTVTKDAEAYLRWYAQEVLFMKTPSAAAKHLMKERLSVVRLENLGKGPSSSGELDGGDTDD